MKIFLDTNVLLDLVQDRAGANAARQIVGLCQGNAWVRLYASFLSMANIAYVLRKKPLHDVKDCLARLARLCNILPMNDSQLMTAIRNCDSPDFEDTLQIMCAEDKGCDVIVTNDITHFRDFTDIPVLTPSDFLAECGKD